MRIAYLTAFLMFLPNLAAQSAQVHPERGYGNLPLAFEPNLGQADPQVRFLTRAAGMVVFFTDTEAVMVLHASEKPRSGRMGRRERPSQVEQTVVRMKLVGARRPLQATGLERLPGISNYFLGNDPKQWRTDIPHYGRVSLEGVYPGVDVVYRGHQRQLEYDFVVAPGARPEVIELAFDGPQSVKVDPNGDLLLETSLGVLRQAKPVVYQEVNGRRVEVAAGYKVQGQRVGFTLARYERSQPLVIDPLILAYSTFLGGNGYDEGDAIAVDASGSAYVTGNTTSSNFPTQSAYQRTLKYSWEVYVTKLAPGGNAVVYSTYLGGGKDDEGFEIAVDGAGYAYIAGATSSSDFPTQAPYQRMLKGDWDAFVTKLAPGGNALVYSTYLGGSGNECGCAIALDGAGSVYVTGGTSSSDFPIQSPFQAVLKGSQDAYVAKLSPDGAALVYSTYLGGAGVEDGNDIAVDAAGSAYVTGSTSSSDFPTKSPFQAALVGSKDAFVTKLSPDGKTLSYSTFLGSGTEDGGDGIAVDAAGSAYVTGTTYAGFPTQSPYQANLKGVQDAFVTKLAPSGSALVYSTYLGGSDYDSRGETLPDEAWSIAVDAAGSAYVAGVTGSPDFPTQSAFQRLCNGCPGSDAFVAKLSPAGNALAYSTFLGGHTYNEARAIAVDTAGRAYVTGVTDTDSFPTQSPIQTTLQGGVYDAFVTKLTLPATITTNPPGLAVAVDGINLTAPQAFDWDPGTNHSIGVTSPQGSGGTRYVFTNWSDGGSQTHSIVASSSLATYIANLSLVTTFPQINSGGVVNNASYALQSSSVAPGSIAALFGTNLTNGTSCLPPACNQSFSNGKLNTTMAGAQVTVNGTPVPIFYAVPTQLGIQIPFEATGTSATVSVSVGGQASTPVTALLGAVSPGIFTTTSDGMGAGSITHVDGSAVTTQNPAHPGELVIFWATGLGQVVPAVPTGALPASVSNTFAPVTLTIGGISFSPDFAGLAGCCAGLNQINARVPFGVSSSNAVPVVLNIGGKSSNTATIAVQ
jgi:uncharacterized protein (TIGR03437 family)